MLPNFEVVVPEKERDVKRDLPAAKIEKPGCLCTAGPAPIAMKATRIGLPVS